MDLFHDLKEANDISSLHFPGAPYTEGSKAGLRHGNSLLLSCYGQSRFIDHW